MSPSTPREKPVPQARPSPPRLALLYVLSIPLAFMAGTMTVEPLAAAGLAAGAFSIIVGITLVAPTAGRLAKERFLLSLAQPDEQDNEMMFHAVGHIVDKMGALAKNPETRVLFAPLFDAYNEQLDKSYKAIVNNIKSQASRGAGAFDPSLLDEDAIAHEFEGILVNKVGGLIDPFLGDVGATDRGKQVVHAKILQAIRGNGGKTGSVAHAGTGGVDFRRG